MNISKSLRSAPLPFLSGKVQSEILRSAQNDSMADECTDVTLASASHLRVAQTRRGLRRSLEAAHAPAARCYAQSHAIFITTGT